MVTKNSFSIRELITPALGYLLVVMICLMAGNSLRHDLSFYNFIRISPELFLFWLLLVPVFINRVIMYEQSSEKDISEINKEWRRVSLELPIVILLFSIFIFSFLNFSFVSSDYSSFKLQGQKLLILVIGILPFYIQTIISWSKWKSNKADEHFNFRSYIFFPALTTCVMSFLVGWSELSNLNVILIPSLIISGYYIISFWDKSSYWNWKFSDWFFLIGLVVIFFYEFVIAIPFKAPSTYIIDAKYSMSIALACVMMSLIMGITETWWFIKDKENERKFHKDDFEFYKNRINKITASLPLIMPLTIFEPHTNNYFYLILLYAVLLCVVWFYGQKIQNGYWRWIRFSFGIILPILFAISLRDIEGVKSIVSNKIAINLLSPISLIVGLIGLIGFIRPREKTSKLFTEFSDEKQIGLTISVISAVLFAVISQIIPEESKLVEKLNLLILFYFVIVFVFIIEIVLKMLKYMGSSSDNITKPSKPNSFLLFLHSGRPITSTLSGVLAFLIIYRIEGDFILSFLKSLPIILVTMLGFIYNDIYDIDKDKKAGKNRPIATGALSAPYALKLTIIFSLFILIYEIMMNNLNSFMLILITLISVILYSPISKKYPLIKIFYTAILCCIPLLYGYSIIGYVIPWFKFVPILIFIIGREIWLDKVDMNGDFLSNIKTIAFYLGNKKSQIISYFSMLIGAGIIILMASNFISQIFSITALAILIFCFFLSLKNEALAIKISRIPMLLGIIALTF